MNGTSRFLLQAAKMGRLGGGGGGQPKLRQNWRRYAKEYDQKGMLTICRGTVPIYKNLNMRVTHTWPQIAILMY